MSYSSKEIFDHVYNIFVDSPKGVFSKREILDLLDGAYSKWMNQSTKELADANADATFRHFHGEREEVKDGQTL